MSALPMWIRLQDTEPANRTDAACGQRAISRSRG